MPFQLQNVRPSSLELMSYRLLLQHKQISAKCISNLLQKKPEMTIGSLVIFIPFITLSDLP